jgi:hypothetical protein
VQSCVRHLEMFPDEHTHRALRWLSSVFDLLPKSI